ncbi:MAG: dienelactone hydrolase family protein, partial [Candidatus Saccharicenans sp.]
MISNKKICYGLLILLIIHVFTGAWAFNPSRVATALDFQQKTLTLEDGTLLRYTLYVPPSISNNKPVPLVLALHYGGTVTPYFGKDILVYLIEPALWNLGAIMVSPDCPGRGWNNPKSEQAILALLDFLLKNYPVDKNKIVITGYSLGAMGTWYLVSRHPDLFSAAIPISGIPREEISLAGNKTPIYAIHSEDDELIPVEQVKQFIQGWQSKGLNIRFEVIRGIGHYE